MYSIVYLNNRGEKDAIGLICINQERKLFVFQILDNEVEIFKSNNKNLELLIDTTIDRYKQNLNALQKNFKNNESLEPFYLMTSNENGIIRFSQFRDSLPSSIYNKFPPFLSEVETMLSPVPYN